MMEDGNDVDPGWTGDVLPTVAAPTSLYESDPFQNVLIKPPTLPTALQERVGHRPRRTMKRPSRSPSDTKFKLPGMHAQVEMPMEWLTEEHGLCRRQGGGRLAVAARVPLSSHHHDDNSQSGPTLHLAQSVVIRGSNGAHHVMLEMENVPVVSSHGPLVSGGVMLIPGDNSLSWVAGGRQRYGKMVVSMRVHQQITGVASTSRSPCEMSLAWQYTTPWVGCRLDLAPSLSSSSGAGGAAGSSTFSALRLRSGMVTLASRTLHQWRVGVGMARGQPKILLSLTTPTTLSSSPRRSVSLDAMWNGSRGWQVAGSLQQTVQIDSAIDKKTSPKALLSHARRFALSLRHTSAQLTTWTWSWYHGSLAIHVPILVVRGGDWSWMLAAQLLYITLVSNTVQDMIANVVQPHREAAQRASEAHRVERGALARRQAMQQQQLMHKQAMARQQNEAAKQGLVIRAATYSHIHGESINVTVPLQFWVTNSDLRLPASSFQHLLGFCNVDCINETPTMSLSNASKSWWAGFRMLSNDDSSTSSDTTVSMTGPTLTVQYEYNGQSHNVTVEDNEALALP